MKKSLTLLFFLTASVFAETGTGLLINTSGEDIDIKSTVQVQKRLDLSDPFLVQFFGSYKASGVLPTQVDTWVHLILNKNFEEALKTIPVVEKHVPNRFMQAYNAGILYVYAAQGLNTLFVDKWLYLSAHNNLLKTEAGVALDHVISQNASQWIIDNGIQLSEEQKNLLNKISNEESRFNFSLQAWNALRSGKNALKWISKLTEKDPLRLKLSTTALISFAKEGELKASAKLIKEVLEPIIEKSKNVEEISNYYLSLARLLYQAGAVEASKHYYYLIPEESKYFITARTELIWTLLRMNDLASVKGELASLKLDIFKDKFYPEIYLVNSIANLKTCQFTEVKKGFDEFIKRNKIWAQKISKNLEETPEVIEKDFFYENTVNNLKQIEKEKKVLSKLENTYWTKSLDLLSGFEFFAKTQKSNELKRRWLNREKILDEAIYKMRFVKIEFISRMRELARDLNGVEDKDEISVYSAAPLRGNEIAFPYDGVLWGDELFNITAQVENLCLQQGKMK